MYGETVGSRVCKRGTTSYQINWYSWPVGKSCNLFFCRVSQLDSEKAAMNIAIGNVKSRSICWTGAASWMGMGELFATSPVLHASCWATTFMLAPFICSQIRHPALQIAEHPEILTHRSGSCGISGLENQVICLFTWNSISGTSFEMLVWNPFLSPWMCLKCSSI